MRVRAILTMDLPLLRVGDTIVNRRYGVKGTNIPVGATVRYEVFNHPNGAASPTWIMTVREIDGRKMLGFDNESSMLIHGQQGSMTILSLPA